MQTDEFECPETKYCWSGEGNKREHVAVAERVLGKALPVGAIVHHANEDKSDNRHENLVICQDRAYHNLLHQRMRARAACGNANWLKCNICLEYDAPENMNVITARARGRNPRLRALHRECVRERANEYYHRRKAA
jgi:hypothetical protein